MKTPNLRLWTYEYTNLSKWFCILLQQISANTTIPSWQSLFCFITLANVNLLNFQILQVLVFIICYINMMRVQRVSPWEKYASCEGNHLIYVHCVISLLQKLAILQSCVLFIAHKLQKKLHLTEAWFSFSFTFISMIKNYWSMVENTKFAF